MSKNFENISLHKLTFDESSFSKEDDKLYNNNPNPNKISTFINGVLNKANLDENDLVYFTTPEDNEFFISSAQENIIKFYQTYPKEKHICLYSSNSVQYYLICANDDEPSLDDIDDVIYLFSANYAILTETFLRYKSAGRHIFGSDQYAFLIIDKILFWALKAYCDMYYMLNGEINSGIFDHEYKSLHWPVFENELTILRNKLKDSTVEDIEENPGPICYKRIFNEYQMKFEKYNWLCEWEEKWKIQENLSNRTYTLKVFFPSVKLSFESGSLLSKKECEEACYQQLYAYMEKDIHPQSGLVMPQGELKAQDEVIENTVLTTTQEKVVIPGVPENINDKFLSENTFSDPSLVGVEFLLSSFVWDPSSTLFSFNIPQVLFDDDNIGPAPISKAFQAHSIYRAKGKMIFKPVSNKFNTGILGFTWVPMYSQLSLQNQLARANIYSLSHLPTKYMNACSANEVELEFNYLYPLNYTSASERAFTLPQNDIGTLLVYPLDQLTQGDQGTRWCEVNMFIHFTDLEFIGKIDGRINPQSGLVGSMKDLAISSLSKETCGISDIVLDKIVKNNATNGNADFPVDPSPGNFIIPNYLPSFATTIGTKQPINSLGLDPSAMVSHTYPIEDDFAKICKVRALFKKVTFTSTGVPSLIASWPNVPLKPFVHYKEADGVAVGARYLTPLAIVSGLFQNYKGRIVYDFLVSMTDKHNVKFMIGTIPAANLAGASIDETYLRNSKFQELNFTDGNFSASYEAPYFGTKKWSRIPSDIRVNQDCHSAAYDVSYVYLFALTRLSYSTGVQPQITMNIFERAGEDFELSVYKPPTMTPIKFNVNVQFMSLYSTWDTPNIMFTSSTLAPNNGSTFAATSSNGVFMNCWFNNVQGFPRAGTARYENKTGVAQSIPGTTQSDLIFFVPVGYNTWDAILICIITNPQQLPLIRGLLKAYAIAGTWESFNALYPHLLVGTTPTFTYLENDRGFVQTWNTNMPLPDLIGPQSGLEGRLSGFQEQRSGFSDTDNRQWGMKDFGENYSSILNLLKRGHNDWPITITLNPSNVYPNAAFRIRVTPEPIYNPTMGRDDPRAFTAGGVLSIIYSGFLGFKGSMHYHLLCPPALNTLLWVNYFPDAFTNRHISIFPVRVGESNYTPTLVPSAPKCYFNLQMNSAVRVKIPYYSCSEFILLNSDIPDNPVPVVGDSAMVKSMGSILVGFDSNLENDLPTQIKLSIVRSVGDDAGLYFFMGFPPMYMYDEFPYSFNLARNSAQADIELNPGPASYKLLANFGQSFGFGVGLGVKESLATGETAEELGSGLIKGFANETLPFLDHFKDALLEHCGKFAVFFKDFNLSNVVLEFATQIGHCVLAKNWHNCIWAILSLFTKFGLFSISKIPKLVSTLINYLKSCKLFSTQPNNGNSDNDISPQNEDHSNLISYVAIFCTSICSLIGISSSSINTKSIASNFTTVLKDSLLCGNALTAFLKSHIDLITDIFYRAKYYLLGKTPDGKLLNMITSNGKFIGNWIKEVDFLCDGNNISNIGSSPDLQVRVRVCYLLGRTLQSQMVLSKSRATNLFSSYYKKIGQKYDELAASGFISHIRETPFVIYNWGPSGVGKSEMSTDLIAHLFQEVGIVPDGELVYTVSPTSAYYDGLKTQKCIYVDDALAVNYPDLIVRQLDLLFSAATSATWRPVMAALEEKKMISAPDLLYMCSNLESITHDMISDQLALNRRLQYKIHTRIKPELNVTNASLLSTEQMENFNHLEFRVHLNPYKWDQNLYTQWMNYAELKVHCLASFKEHRIRAKASQERRLIRENMTRFGKAISDITYDDLINENFIKAKIDEFVQETIETDTGYGFISNFTSDAYKDIFDTFYNVSNSVICSFKDLFISPVEEEITVQSESDNPLAGYNKLVEQLDYAMCDVKYAYLDIIDEFESRSNGFKHSFSAFLTVLNNNLWAITNFEYCIMTCAIRSGKFCHCKIIDYECRTSNELCRGECIQCEEIINKFQFCHVPDNTRTNFMKSFYTFATETINKFIEQLTSFYNTTFGKIILIIVGLAATYVTLSNLGNLINYILKYFGFDTTPELLVQNHYDGITGAKSKKPALRSNIKSLQLNIRPQSQDILDKVTKMRKNFRYIAMGSAEDFEQNKDVRILAILGLQGRKYLFLEHYNDDIKHHFAINNKVKLIDGNTTIELTEENFKPNRFTWRRTEDSASELGIWDAPDSMSMITDITSFFISESKSRNLGSDVYIVNNLQQTNRPDVTTKISEFTNKKETTLSKFNHIIQYDNFSQNGFCMSIIFSVNLKAPIAIHAFGSDVKGKGYGELIFREHLSDAKANIDIIHPPNLDDLDPLPNEFHEDYMGTLKILGKVPLHQIPFAKGKTQLEKSPIFDEISVQNKEPAPLSPFDKRINHEFNPMIEGVKKHGNPPLSFNQDHLKICADDTLRLLMQNAQPCRIDTNGKFIVNELSISDAILGIPEHDFKALDLTTSPGYPLLSIRGKGDPGKRKFINAGNDANGNYRLYGISSILRNMINAETELRKKRKMAFSPAIDCLKDELLKPEKAKRKGGTRVFSISPVQQVIAGKRLFGDWLMSYRKNWAKLEHCISINPESSDWMFLYNQLKRYDNILEGDYSNFGPQIDSAVAKAALKNIVEWYRYYGATVEHINQLEVMIEEFINAPHICNNYFYSTTSGIISGSFATAELNSEINKLYIRLAWCSLVDTDMFNFNENVTLYTYGDDIIASVSDDYIDKFNVETIGKFFKDHKITFTNASKSATWIKSIDLEDATFLKRGFRIDKDISNICFANLDKISIEEQLNWIKRNGQNDIWELVFQSIDSCLRSATMWGREYYDNLKEKINNSMIKHNKTYVFKDFDRQIKDIYYPVADKSQPIKLNIASLSGKV